MADYLGFGNITEEVLDASRKRHNQFPLDASFPPVDERSDGFHKLCAIIVKYNVQGLFNLRRIHRHMTISEGEALLGTSIAELHGYWIKPTRISDIDLNKVSGYEISANTTGFMSKGGIRSSLIYSEFREGLPVNIGNIDSNFFREFADCLRMEGLENTYGLEVKQGQPEKMIEFPFDIGLLLVGEEEVRPEVREGAGQFALRVTEWTITNNNGTVKHYGTKYCLVVPDETPPHREIIVVDRYTRVSDIVESLRDQGLLVDRITSALNT